MHGNFKVTHVRQFLESRKAQICALALILILATIVSVSLFVTESPCWCAGVEELVTGSQSVRSFLPARFVSAEFGLCIGFYPSTHED